jgi:iron(III) transport system ATP-binding protein
MTEGVIVEDLVAGYGSDPVVRGTSCRVLPGSLLAVVGASGSGKTTLLRAIAGFLPCQSGTITIADRCVTGPGVAVPPEGRRIGVVTQDGSLFPHLTVERNIAFGLPRRTLEDGTPTAERVADLLDVVGLEGLGGRYPHELSGGQQQRVALARALAPRPQAMLLDEPFSALDAGLRTELGLQVRDLLAGTGTASILVTHDQDEALSLADQVALLIEGRIVQQGSPEELYAHPRSLGVASFLGEVNLLPVLGVSPEGRVLTSLGPVDAPGATSARPDSRVVLRPEQLTVVPSVDAGGPHVVDVAYFGHDSIVDVELHDGTRVRARVLGSPGLHPGDAVIISVREPGLLL